MSTMVQMTVQNVTPQTRRFFVLGGMESSGRLDIADPYAVAFGAWQSFLLAPGDHGYTALSSKCQVAARSLRPDAQRQTVLVESDPGYLWVFELGTDNSPQLANPQNQHGAWFAIANGTHGPARYSLYNNFAPLWTMPRPAPTDSLVTLVFTRLFFYVSVAVVDPEQPIVLEANIGEFPAMSPPSHLTAQYRQDNGVTAWRFT